MFVYNYKILEYLFINYQIYMRSIYLSTLSEWRGGQTVARVGMGRIGWYTIGGPGRVARQGGVARLGHGWVGGSGQGGVTGRCAGWIGKKRVLTTVEEHTRVFKNFNGHCNVNKMN